MSIIYVTSCLEIAYNKSSKVTVGPNPVVWPKHGEIEHLSLQIEHKQKQEKEDSSRIDWRRNKVQELSSQGNSQREIAQILVLVLIK